MWLDLGKDFAPSLHVGRNKHRALRRTEWRFTAPHDAELMPVYGALPLPTNVR
jgi:hypothetical protein